MPRGVKKENLPAKICIVCDRPYTWRKKWERSWDEITTCSKSCNRRRRRAGGRPVAAGRDECDDDDDDDDDGGGAVAGRGEAGVGDGINVDGANRDIGGDRDRGFDSLGDVTHDEDDARPPAACAATTTTTTTNPDGNGNNGSANAMMTKLVVLAALAGSTAAFARAPTPVAARTPSRAATSAPDNSDPRNEEIGDHRSAPVDSRAEVGRGVVAGAEGGAGDDCRHARIIASSGGTLDGDDDPNDSDDDASADVGRSLASSSPTTTTTSTTTTTTTSPTADDDDARSRRKAEKKRKKAERRAQREGCGDPAAGRKPCSLCGRPADLLVRCAHDESGAWVSSFVALFLGVPRRILSYLRRRRSE